MGKLDVKKTDLSYCKIAHEDVEIRLLSAVVYCVALKRNIKLALTQYLSQDGQVKTTKLYFATDLDLGAWYIVKHY